MSSKPPQYWDAVARDWAIAEPQRLWRAYCDLVNTELLKRWLPREEVPRLLKTDLFDEATGGTGLYPLLAGTARSAVGIDISSVTLRRARARHRTLQPVGADVRTLPFADQTFDVVVSNSTLDHFDSLDDVAGALAELHRVLKHGGQLLLTLDNLCNPAVAVRNALPYRLLARLRVVPYYVGVTCGPRRLRRMVADTGLAVEQVDAVMHCPRAPAVLVANVLDRLDHAPSKALFLRSLMGWERLTRWPTRYLTGYFIALKAVRPDRIPKA